MSDALRVSVVVPTYQRAAALERCLTSLERADYPGDRLEVLVVDDGGGMALEGVCASFEGRLTIRLLRQPNSGAAVARNRGAAAAQGDVLLFTDDDCLVHAGWIRALAAAAERHPSALVGGRTVNAVPENLYASASQLLVDRLCVPHGGSDEPLFVNGNNLGVLRDAFASAGGFDPTFRTSAGEDRELSARFTRLGRPLLFVREGVVEHANVLTFGTFLRQHVNYGRAACRLRHSTLRVAPLPFGGLGFYVGLLLLPLGSATPRRWWQAVALRGLLGVAQLANAAGLVAEWLRPRVRAIPTAPEHIGSSS